jgi:hypothetical protein
LPTATISLIIYNYLLLNGNMWKQRLYNAISLKANILVFGDEGIGKKTAVFATLSSLSVKYNPVNYASGDTPGPPCEYVVAYNFSNYQLAELLPKWIYDTAQKYILVCNGGPEKIKAELLECDCIQILARPPTKEELKAHIMNGKDAAYETNALKLVQYFDAYTHKWSDAEYLSSILLDSNISVYSEFAINNLGICRYNQKTLREDYHRNTIYKINNHQQDAHTQICLEGLNELEKIIIVSAVIASYSLQSNDIRLFGKYEVKKARSSTPRQVCRRFPAERLFAICNYFCELLYPDEDCRLSPNGMPFFCILQDLCEKGYIKLYTIRSRINDLCSIYYKSNVSINQAIKIGQILNISLEDYINS